MKKYVIGSMEIYVFGSNAKGIHNGGQAKDALLNHGAISGRGIGLQGTSYAIPTKRSLHEKMPLREVREHVLEFIKFARSHTEFTFEVQRIGCGNAGFTDDDMKPLFENSPENVHLHFR